MYTFFCFLAVFAILALPFTVLVVSDYRAHHITSRKQAVKYLFNNQAWGC